MVIEKLRRFWKKTPPQTSLSVDNTTSEIDPFTAPITERHNVGNAVLFATPDQKVRIYAVGIQIPDENLLITERGRLSNDIRRCKDKFLNSSLAFPQARKLRTELTDPQRLREAFDLVMHYTREASGGNQQEGTLTKLMVPRYLLTGAQLRVLEVINDQTRLAKKAGNEDIYAPFAETLKFSAAAELLIPVVEGIALIDFTQFNKDKETVPYYKALVVGLLINQKIPAPVIAATVEGILKEYPSLTSEAIREIPRTLESLFHFEIHDKIKVVDSNNPLSDNARECVNELCSGIRRVKDATQAVLTNPQSKEFESVKEFMRNCLEADQLTRFAALNSLGLVRKSAIFDLYRKALAFVREGNNTDFYNLLASSVKEYAEEASVVIDDLYMSQTAYEVLDPEKKEENMPAPNLTELGQLASKITGKTRRRGYDFINLGLENTAFVRAERVSVKFNPNRPRIFTIALEFEKDGKNTTVEAVFNTTPNKSEPFDWNLLEDPNCLGIYEERENLSCLKNNLFIAAQTALESIDLMLENERQALKAVEVFPSNPRPKRTKPEPDPVYEIRKQVKRAEQNKKRRPRKI